MAESLQITSQGTPNPNAAKFTLNRTVAAQGKTYRLPAAPSPASTSAAQAGDASTAEPAWVQQLLRIPGVTQVFAINNFISVNKTPEADWAVIGPQVEQVLRHTLA